MGGRMKNDKNFEKLNDIFKNGIQKDEIPLLGQNSMSPAAYSSSNQKQQLATQAQRGTGKYMTWSWRLIRRKQFLCLFVIAIFVLYINSTLMNGGDEERISVVHYSHVPGMNAKRLTTEANSDKSNCTQDKSISLTNNTIDSKNKLHKLEDSNQTHLVLSNDSTKQPTDLSSNNVENRPSNFASDVRRRVDYERNLETNISKADSLRGSSSSSNDSINHFNSSAATMETLPNASVTFDDNLNNDIDGNTESNDIEMSFSPTSPSPSPSQHTNVSTSLPEGYLVWSERCKMPNVDPYLSEVMHFFRREKYKPCSDQIPLTSVAYSEASQAYVLRVNEDLISSYTKSKKIDCCYQVIERNGTGINADKEASISLSDCISFLKSTKLAPYIDNILVKCKAKRKQIYINGHAMLPERAEIRERLKKWKTDDKQKKRHRPPSVLMIGIDSISRINLIRAMPKTAQYLYDNEWFEMSGYNKIDDNTFPNLMAVLTGMNRTTAYRKCPPTVLHGLDDCNFIWRTFRDHGYVTAYAEDGASINTFNYMKIGFERPPVDYYMRPFLLSAEKHLRVRYKSSLIYCLGYQHSADFIYEYALELVRRYKHEPYFGLFWTNTFSHNAISDCSSMDESMVEYLKRFSVLGTLENSIVVFFSDHGLRFGPTRATYSGHLEERLPFMFIWLPPQLKRTHPEFVNALSVNKNRLTNPYDLHMTLKHVLQLSGRVDNQSLLRPAENCERCQTLLEPVPHNRSCEDISIEDHWCTCIPYQSVYKKSPTVQKLAKSAVQYINNYVATYKNGSFANICATLQLHSVESAYRAQPQDDSSSSSSSTPPISNLIDNTDPSNRSNGMETYRIIFQTKPNKAIFEATIRYNPNKLNNATTADDAFKVTGEISRLNSYASDSDCAEDGGAKKYCSCRKKKII